MKKSLWIAMAVLAVVALTLPAFAVDFKYGGMFYTRYQSNNNLTGSNGNPDDNNNYFDQRVRMYFTFIASENLRVVTKFEVDTLWGNSFDKFSTGGGVTADAINLETKNVYVDFNIPYTPVRATLGVQGLAFLTGWIVDDDFSSAAFSTKFDPVNIQFGYIAGQNDDVTSTRDNIDDVFLSVDYTYGPFAATLVGFYQDGHDVIPVTGSKAGPYNFVDTHDNQLLDIGVALTYKQEMFDVSLNYVQNLGSYDDVALSNKNVDYRGYMVEAGANFNWNPLTFTVGGFMTSGDTSPANDTNDAFVYPVGKSHYWSELLGLGYLDQTTGSSYLNPVRVIPKDARVAQQLADENKGDFTAADSPSNLWTVTAGVSWQALEKTKLTATYYYVGTEKDVLANLNTGKKSNTIGNEIDFYVDQEVVDNLNLKLVGAYLFTDNAYTIFPGDDDAYELGAVLQLKF